jgi:hypothetical protein
MKNVTIELREEVVELLKESRFGLFSDDVEVAIEDIVLDALRKSEDIKEEVEMIGYDTYRVVRRAQIKHPEAETDCSPEYLRRYSMKFPEQANMMAPF